MKDTKTALVGSLLQYSINILLDWWLIFGRPCMMLLATHPPLLHRQLLATKLCGAIPSMHGVMRKVFRSSRA